MTETYGLLAIPLGFLIASFRKKPGHVTAAFAIFLLCLFNLFQTWQFCMGIIDPERMTGKYYWSVFLKTSVPPDAHQHLEPAQPQTAEELFTDDELKYNKKEILFLDFENPRSRGKPYSYIDTFGYRNSGSFLLDSLTEFSPGFTERYYDVTNRPYAWIRTTVDVFPTMDPEHANAALTIYLEAKGKAYKYRARGIRGLGLQANKWSRITMDYMTPPFIRHSYDKLTVVFWNIDGQRIFIDNLKATFLNLK